jgi:proteic killer suppression protein
VETQAVSAQRCAIRFSGFSLLDAAASPEELDIPGLRLHALKGDLKGFWSVSVSGNWRVVFRYADGDAFEVDLLDYH